MLCNCNKQLTIGSMLTKLGNEIEYMECEDCGLVEINGIGVDEDED